MLMVFGVIQQRTVDLSYLATFLNPNTQTSSRYRRLQRFFSEFTLVQSHISALILKLLSAHTQSPWVLAMDRTNWKFGRKHINILVVSVIVGKVGFPICWMSLPKLTKCGNSKTYHRIKIMKRLLKLICATDIKVLTMDREFIGEEWLGWLDLQGVAYIVRIKSCHDVNKQAAEKLARRNRWKKFANEHFTVFGQEVFFASKRIKKGRSERLIVISNRFKAAQLLELYRLRWGIELFFGHCKKKGFNFEDTHITKGVRISQLLAVIAVAFSICYLRAIQMNQLHRIPKYLLKRKSFFRIGMEEIQRIISASLEEELRLFYQFIKDALQHHNKSNIRSRNVLKFTLTADNKDLINHKIVA